MSTPPVEKLRRKGCCGDGRRESHGGGDDGARGGCGDGGCHAGAGAGRRRVWVAAGPPVGQAAAPCWNGRQDPLQGLRVVLRRYGAAAESCFAQIWITGYRGVYFRPRGLGGAPGLRITRNSYAIEQIE